MTAQPIMNAMTNSAKTASCGSSHHANDSLNALRSWIGRLDFTSGRLAEALDTRSAGVSLVKYQYQICCRPTKTACGRE